MREAARFFKSSSRRVTPDKPTQSCHLKISSRWKVRNTPQKIVGSDKTWRKWTFDDKRMQISYQKREERRENCMRLPSEKSQRVSLGIVWCHFLRQPSSRVTPQMHRAAAIVSELLLSECMYSNLGKIAVTDLHWELDAFCRCTQVTKGVFEGGHPQRCSCQMLFKSSLCD